MARKRKGCAVVALIVLAVLGAVASVAVMVSADAPVQRADGEAAPTTAGDNLLDSVKNWSAETGGPGLAKLIRASRDAAIKEGVRPIPPAMRARLSGFFPDTLLDRVRYRVGRGEELSIQAVLLS
ncbi:MAG: hypothetical protein KIT00_13850, partial [Rhodospirillales bacterium]|nr:hypothetical protein [Rhodospirillales bacterium]